MYPYYIIEHATRGVYVGEDWSSSGNNYGPRFRWSIPRNKGEVFYSEPQAKQRLARILGGTGPELGSMQSKPVPGCYLLRFTREGAGFIWRNQRWEPYK